MKRFFAITIIALVPTAALASYYEAEFFFSWWGSRANVIARGANHYDDQERPAVEVECDWHIGSTHLLMTTDEARAFADSIALAAEEADAL